MTARDMATQATNKARSAEQATASLVQTAGVAIQEGRVDRAGLRQLVADLSDRVAALERKPAPVAQKGDKGDAGVATIRTVHVALGTVVANTDVTVTFTTPMPSATYNVQVELGPGLAGKLSAAVKTKTLAAVVVSLTVTGSVAVASAFTLTAWA